MVDRCGVDGCGGVVDGWVSVGVDGCEVVGGMGVSVGGWWIGVG